MRQINLIVFKVCLYLAGFFFKISMQALVRTTRISQASGEHLEMIAIQYGLRREPNEDDKSLRLRVIDLMYSLQLTRKRRK